MCGHCPGRKTFSWGERGDGGNFYQRNDARGVYIVETARAERRRKKREQKRAERKAQRSSK